MLIGDSKIVGFSTSRRAFPRRMWPTSGLDANTTNLMEDGSCTKQSKSRVAGGCGYWVASDKSRDELYKNRSSGKTDSQ